MQGGESMHGPLWQPESTEICRHRQRAHTDPLSLTTEGSGGSGHLTASLHSF